MDTLNVELSENNNNTKLYLMQSEAGVDHRDKS